VMGYWKKKDKKFKLQKTTCDLRLVLLRCSLS
jgi:hypothetical protein